MTAISGTTPTGGPVLQLVGVHKVYRTTEVETSALTDVSLTVQAGEFLSVAGPSGCGKSTLLAIMGLLEPPTSGRVRVMGAEAAGLDAAGRARMRGEHIGFVFQSFNLIDELDVLDNVALPLRYRGVKPAERSALAADALTKVGLGHRMRHHPSQLSGGQQQRAAVARAIVGRPALVLADEPTGNLDSTNGAAIMDLLSALHGEGTTIVLVTHDPRYAGYASREVAMQDGMLRLDTVAGSMSSSAVHSES